MVYIKEYTALNPKEKRQLFYKRKFKVAHPEWDDSMVLLTKLVEQYMPKRPSVLDAGCGHGNFVVDELKEKLGRVVGVDATAEDAANNTSIDELVVANLERLPFENNSFDLAVSLWVLEHIQNPQAVFKEIARVLQPGGLFAFVTPNSRNFLIRLRKFMSHEFAEKLVLKLYGREHHHTFDVFYRANSVNMLQSLAKAHGFEPVVLQENFDPSYTSFGAISYFITQLTYKIPVSFFRTHIIGIFKKV